VAEVGIERLATGDDQEYGAQRDQSDRAVARDKRDCIIRIDGEKHAGVVADMQHTGEGENDEPGRHDRAEEARHTRSAAPLYHEQQRQDYDRERDHEVLEGGRHQFETFDRRQHRDRRRDH
jgi:hypothetical protein